MHRRRHGSRHRMIEEFAAVLEQGVVFADYAMRGSHSQAHDNLRANVRELRLQPRMACRYFGGGGLLVDPPLTALFELEVLHGVGDVDFFTRDSGVGECLIEQPARRSDEGFPCEILLIAGLLPYYHQARAGRPFAEYRLCGMKVKVAFPAALDRFGKLRQGGGR